MSSVLISAFDKTAASGDHCPMEHLPKNMHKIVAEGITFDDVLLIPQHSAITPDQADTSTRLTRNIRLNIPLISAPMDTVTEATLAIALAQEGGIGIIHKNLPPDVQAREVAKVKRSENGVITDPITLSPNDTVAKAQSLMDQQNVSGFPVTDDGSSHGRVVGILTRRDLRFIHREARKSGASGTKSFTPDALVRDVMTKDALVTAPAQTKLEEAEGILNQSRVEKLLLVNNDGGLAGLITMRDIDNMRKHPNACRDARGRLRVGAAVGVGAAGMERVEALIEAEVDVIVVDTAHGHSENVLQQVKAIRKRYDIEIIAGNIATADAARDLIAAGVDALKVGIGPGSICTTRVVSGVGVPQLTAIMNVLAGVEESGVDVPVIADGGIRQSGDIAKAIGAGASSVMLGSLFAGLDESPGELILHQGRRFKSYRGMGSQGAMVAGSADRYGQQKSLDVYRAETAKSSSDPLSGVKPPTLNKLVPEGVEGRVPYRGPMSEFVYQMVGGLRAAMGYLGCSTIEELREHATFVRVSSASVIESHPHDIQITKEAPNYTSAITGQ